MESKSHEMEILLRERELLIEDEKNMEEKKMDVSRTALQTVVAEKLLREKGIGLFNEKYVFSTVLLLGASFGIAYFRKIAKAMRGG